MHRRPLIIGITVAAWILACAAVAAPSTINNLTGQTSFTAEDEAVIADHIAQCIGRMTPSEDGTAGEVSTARRRLLEPIRLSTTQFRLAYSSALVPLLEDVVRGENQHTAINALIVLQELGTDKALAALVVFCDRSTEPRMPIRLTASRACRRLLNGRDVSATRVRTALRALVIATEHEDHGLVLRRQLEALLSVDDPEARERLAEALGGVVKRMEEATTPPEIETVRAVDSLLPKLRHTFLNLSGQDQTTWGKQLAEPLVNTLGLAQAQWDKARQDNPDKLRELYGRIILVSEQILKRIDPMVRPAEQSPNTALHRAWESSDRQRFEADWRQWRTVVRTPLYGAS